MLTKHPKHPAAVHAEEEEEDQATKPSANDKLALETLKGSIGADATGDIEEQHANWSGAKHVSLKEVLEHPVFAAMKAVISKKSMQIESLTVERNVQNQKLQSFLKSRETFITEFFHLANKFASATATAETVDGNTAEPVSTLN